MIMKKKMGEKLLLKIATTKNIVVPTAFSNQPDLQIGFRYLPLIITAGENNDDNEPDLLVLLGKAHLLVHVQVQHVLWKQVHLKTVIIPQKYLHNY